MKKRDPREIEQELLEQADETRRLIARYSEESDAWRSKALLSLLKNEQAILEGLAVLLGRPAATPAPVREEILRVEELEVVEVRTETLAAEPTVDAALTRAIIEEFDNRDHLYDRGLQKLNTWCAGGKGALPFQKREMHAYINRGANSEAMIARIESELMSREGFTRRLGRLKVDGLEGDILVYEKGA